MEESERDIIDAASQYRTSIRNHIYDSICDSAYDEGISVEDLDKEDIEEMAELFVEAGFQALKKSETEIFVTQSDRKEAFKEWCTKNNHVYIQNGNIQICKFNNSDGYIIYNYVQDIMEISVDTEDYGDSEDYKKMFENWVLECGGTCSGDIATLCQDPNLREGMYGVVFWEGKDKISLKIDVEGVNINDLG